MKIINLTALSERLAPCAATIGFFDGVHRGHQYLVRRLVNEAHERDLEATVITFDRHPRQVLRADYQPRMLNTLAEKCALLSKTGVDNVVVLSFDEQMAALPANDFMQSVLCDKLNVRLLAMGYDNRFGNNRNESFADYVAYGASMGIEVIRNDAFGIGDNNISSSMIRSLLLEGEVDMAARCLGYAYMIKGRVVHGHHIGATMGFPTANIELEASDKLVPANGVYAVRVWVAGDDRQYSGMMNIGLRPTFSGNGNALEVHIFDFDGNLYDSEVSVAFACRLRAEKRFRNASELANQLKRDAEQANRLLDQL